MPETMPSPAPIANRELIPGYTIEHSIGSGGFGEVFAATAPGGIRKAVKVVYGRADESRAEREMKSLERIKEVRHPFVISIERIELAGGQLVIVTELADRSLRDRFEEATAAGRPGVPRDELLGFLADAADALDFLYERHSLQHLDIKPENLLLLDAHCKVADFGLLKDLRETNPSLLGGVTPHYAPPEVLDGQPDGRSDQYALAIVYQEMLTGQLPFNGRTAGQLAAQHLHSDPNLTPLPTADRYAIGRALSKTTSRRFESCRAMVEALRNPPRSAIAKSPTVQNHLQTPSDAARRRDEAAVSNSPLLQAVPREPVVREPVATDPSAPARPTVVVGLGGLGCEAVRRLRRDLVRQLGTADLDSIGLLAIDSDLAAAEELRSGLEADDADALRPDQIVTIPLRTAAEYRANRESHLGWLSRRWLYNVPRTRQTEGIRPLGRLALIDHLPEVRRRLDAALAAATRPQAEGVSASLGELPVAEAPPQVFVVASATGGLSSGAAIDLTYGLTELLEARGIEGDPHLLLLGAVPGQPKRRDLALANATALLGELHHFGLGGATGQEGYPGDGSGRPDGIAASGRFPIASMTLLDCPNQWDDRDDPSHPAELAAAYLMQNVLGPSAAFFAHAREADATARPTLRNVKLTRLGGGRRQTAGEADAIVHDLLETWVASCRVSQRGTGRLADDATYDDEEAGIVALLDSLGVVGEVHAGEVIDAALADCGELVTHLVSGAAHVPREKMFSVMHKAVGMTDGALEPVRRMRAAMVERVEQSRSQRVAAFRKLMFAAGPDGAPTVDDIRRRMYAIAAELTSRLLSVQQQAQTLRTDCERRERGEGAIDAALLTESVAERLLAQSACLEAEEIQRLINAVLETGQLFDAAGPALAAVQQTLPSRESLAVEPLPRAKSKPIERAAAAAAADALGMYWLMKIGEPDHAQTLRAALSEVAHEALRQRALAGLTPSETVAQTEPQFGPLSGTVRWLTSGPSQTTAAAFVDSVRERTDREPTVAVTGRGDVVLCCESGDLPIPSVTQAIVGPRLDLLRTATQLRSRGDIEWIW